MRRALYATVIDLRNAMHEGKIAPANCQVYQDKNELYIYGPDGDLLFEGAVGPKEVGALLGLPVVEEV